MVDIYGNSIEVIMNNTGTILTGILGWFTSVFKFVIGQPILIFFILFPMVIYAIRIALKYTAFQKFKNDFFDYNEEDYKKSQQKYYNGQPHELSGVTEDDPEYIASRDYYKTHKAPKDDFEL